MVIQLSYIAPFLYKIDEYGEYVQIKGVNDDFSMTNSELDEWADELKKISHYMVELHIKNKEKNG